MDKSEILYCFEEFFALHGFHLVESLHQYRKNTDFGFQCIIISSSEYEKSHLVEIHIGVRHEEVEKAAFRLTNGLLSFEHDSMTFVTSLARLAGKVFMRFQIDDRHQLDLMKVFVEDYLNQNGFDFLDKLGDIHFLESLYNNKPEDKKFFYNFYNKALRGLVLARYVSNPRYESIRQIYDHELQRMNLPAKDRYKFKSLSFVMDHYSMN